MSAFTFDTAGVILTPRGTHWDGVNWTDLSPFVQGFMEGLFAEPGLSKSQAEADGHITRVPPSFSDLSPAALALILRDCESRLMERSGWNADAENGRIFWRNRHEGRVLHFPPLRPFLNDEGKIELEVAS